MGRSHVPKNILRIRGSDKNHPARMKVRENEPENIKPLRDPPAHLSKLNRAAYAEIVELSIPGVLGEADTLAVEQAASLLVKCRGLCAEPPTAAERRLLFSYLGQMGMLPVDRAKLSIEKPKAPNRFDDDL